MFNWKELTIVVLCVGGLFCMGAKLIESKSAEWQKIRCQKNLAAIYKAAASYQNDHNGAIVPYIDKNKKPWKFWYMFILKYANDPTIFYCPSNQRAAVFFADEVDPLEPKSFSVKSQSYGMNYYLGSKKHELNIKNVNTPEKIIYFGDSKTNYLRPTKWCWKDDWAPLHDKKTNFVFMDGSVKLMGPATLGICHKLDNWKKDTTHWYNWKK